jgi:hypothetical protein
MIAAFLLIRSTAGGAGVLDGLGVNSLLKTNGSKQLMVVFGG